MTKPREYYTCASCKSLFRSTGKRQKFCSLHCVLYPRVQRGGDDECWPWTGGTNDRGYGQVRLGQTVYYAHRLSLSLSGIEVPSDLEVLHQCDNPRCCNPKHLRLGSHLENIRDMDRKGRRRTVAYAGEANHLSKLAEQDVLDIRRRHGMGEQQTTLAREYGIGQSAVWMIVNRRNWRHI